MTEGLQPELAGIRDPGGKPLRFGFHDQVIRPLQRTRDIPAERNLASGQLGLGRVININADDVKRARGGEVVNIRLDTERIAFPGKVKVAAPQNTRRFIIVTLIIFFICVLLLDVVEFIVVHPDRLTEHDFQGNRGIINQDETPRKFVPGPLKY